MSQAIIPQSVVRRWTDPNLNSLFFIIQKSCLDPIKKMGSISVSGLENDRMIHYEHRAGYLFLTDVSFSHPLENNTLCINIMNQEFFSISSSVKNNIFEMIILLNGSYIRFCTEEYIENSIFTNFFVHLEQYYESFNNIKSIAFEAEQLRLISPQMFSFYSTNSIPPHTLIINGICNSTSLFSWVLNDGTLLTVNLDGNNFYESHIKPTKSFISSLTSYLTSSLSFTSNPIQNFPSYPLILSVCSSEIELYQRNGSYLSHPLTVFINKKGIVRMFDLKTLSLISEFPVFDTESSPEEVTEAFIKLVPVSKAGVHSSIYLLVLTYKLKEKSYFQIRSFEAAELIDNSGTNLELSLRVSVSLDYSDFESNIRKYLNFRAIKNMKLKQILFLSPENWGADSLSSSSSSLVSSPHCLFVWDLDLIFSSPTHEITEQSISNVISYLPADWTNIILDKKIDEINRPKMKLLHSSLENYLNSCNLSMNYLTNNNQQSYSSLLCNNYYNKIKNLIKLNNNNKKLYKFNEFLLLLQLNFLELIFFNKKNYNNLLLFQVIEKFFSINLDNFIQFNLLSYRNYNSYEKFEQYLNEFLSEILLNNIEKLVEEMLIYSSATTNSNSMENFSSFSTSHASVYASISSSPVYDIVDSVVFQNDKNEKIKLSNEEKDYLSFYCFYLNEFLIFLSTFSLSNSHKFYEILSINSSSNFFLLRATSSYTSLTFIYDSLVDDQLIIPSNNTQSSSTVTKFLSYFKTNSNKQKISSSTSSHNEFNQLYFQIPIETNDYEKLKGTELLQVLNDLTELLTTGISTSSSTPSSSTFINLNILVELFHKKFYDIIHKSSTSSIDSSSLYLDIEKYLNDTLLKYVENDLILKKLTNLIMNKNIINELNNLNYNSKKNLNYIKLLLNNKLFFINMISKKLLINLLNELINKLIQEKLILNIFYFIIIKLIKNINKLNKLNIIKDIKKLIINNLYSLFYLYNFYFLNYLFFDTKFFINSSESSSYSNSLSSHVSLLSYSNLFDKHQKILFNPESNIALDDIQLQDLILNSTNQSLNIFENFFQYYYNYIEEKLLKTNKDKEEINFLIFQHVFNIILNPYHEESMVLGEYLSILNQPMTFYTWSLTMKLVYSEKFDNQEVILFTSFYNDLYHKAKINYLKLQEDISSTSSTSNSSLTSVLNNVIADNYINQISNFKLNENKSFLSILKKISYNNTINIANLNQFMQENQSNIVDYYLNLIDKNDLIKNSTDYSLISSNILYYFNMKLKNFQENFQYLDNINENKSLNSIALYQNSKNLLDFILNNHDVLTSSLSIPTFYSSSYLFNNFSIFYHQYLSNSRDRFLTKNLLDFSYQFIQNFCLNFEILFNNSDSSSLTNIIEASFAFYYIHLRSYFINLLLEFKQSTKIDDDNMNIEDDFEKKVVNDFYSKLQHYDNYFDGFLVKLVEKFNYLTVLRVNNLIMNQNVYYLDENNEFSITWNNHIEKLFQEHANIYMNSLLIEKEVSIDDEMNIDSEESNNKNFMDETETEEIEILKHLDVSKLDKKLNRNVYSEILFVLHLFNNNLYDAALSLNNSPINKSNYSQLIHISLYNNMLKLLSNEEKISLDSNLLNILTENNDFTIDSTLSCQMKKNFWITVGASYFNVTSTKSYVHEEKDEGDEMRMDEEVEEKNNNLSCISADDNLLIEYMILFSNKNLYEHALSIRDLLPTNMLDKLKYDPIIKILTILLKLKDEEYNEFLSFNLTIKQDLTSFSSYNMEKSTQNFYLFNLLSHYLASYDNKNLEKSRQNIVLIFHYLFQLEKKLNNINYKIYQEILKLLQNSFSTLIYEYSNNKLNKIEKSYDILSIYIRNNKYLYGLIQLKLILNHNLKNNKEIVNYHTIDTILSYFFNKFHLNDNSLVSSSSSSSSSSSISSSSFNYDDLEDLENNPIKQKDLFFQVVDLIIQIYTV